MRKINSNPTARLAHDTTNTLSLLHTHIYTHTKRERKIYSRSFATAQIEQNKKWVHVWVVFFYARLFIHNKYIHISCQEKNTRRVCIKIKYIHLYTKFIWLCLDKVLAGPWLYFVFIERVFFANEFRQQPIFQQALKMLKYQHNSSVLWDFVLVTFRHIIVQHFDLQEVSWFVRDNDKPHWMRLHRWVT